jgi:hypothetical protein
MAIPSAHDDEITSLVATGNPFLFLSKTDSFCFLFSFNFFQMLDYLCLNRDLGSGYCSASLDGSVKEWDLRLLSGPASPREESKRTPLRTFATPTNTALWSLAFDDYNALFASGTVL